MYTFYIVFYMQKHFDGENEQRSAFGHQDGTRLLFAFLGGGWFIFLKAVRTKKLSITSGLYTWTVSVAFCCSVLIIHTK